MSLRRMHPQYIAQRFASRARSGTNTRQMELTSAGDTSMQLDEALVRERAYALWLHDGAVYGRADHYWFQAEREIRAVSEATIATPSKRVRKGLKKPSMSPKRRSTPNTLATH